MGPAEEQKDEIGKEKSEDATDEVCTMSSAQRVGFFNIGSGRVGYWKKYRVAGWARVGVEIYSWVFSGIFFTLGYFQVFLGIFGCFRV